MKDLEGQGVSKIQMRIDGQWKTVYPTGWVAEHTNHSRQYIAQLCDQGKLIATKHSGLWWIHDEPLRNIFPDFLPYYMEKS